MTNPIDDIDFSAVNNALDDAPVPTKNRYGVDQDGRVKQFTDEKCVPIDDIDSQITEILAEALDVFISEDSVAEIVADIKNLLLEARLDEIGSVKTEYGRYIAETYINGEVMTVQDRYAALQKELGNER